MITFAFTGIAVAPLLLARMNFSTYKTASGVTSCLYKLYVTGVNFSYPGFLLPSIHSAPPFFTSVLLDHPRFHR
jgi:hypothetical protein